MACLTARQMWVANIERLSQRELADYTASMAEELLVPGEGKREG